MLLACQAQRKKRWPSIAAAIVEKKVASPMKAFMPVRSADPEMCNSPLAIGEVSDDDALVVALMKFAEESTND